jgi:dipeptidyl aminopeptidase/acylaminoacyl peptidase
MAKPEFDDLLKLRGVSSPQADPARGRIAISSGPLTKEFKSGSKSEIWFVYETGKTVKVTSGEFNDYRPQFSCDGELLGFISDRPKNSTTNAESNSFFVFSGLGAEPWRAPVPGSVQDFQWIDDQKVLINSQDERPDNEKGSSLAGDDQIEFEAKPKFSSLWLLDAESSNVKKVTSGVQVWEFSASNDGRVALAVVSEKPFESSWYRSKLALINLESGSVEVLYEPGFRQIGAPRISPDKRYGLFTCSLWSDRGSQNGDLYIVDIEKRSVRNLTEGSDYTVSWAEWESKTSAVFLAHRADEQVFLRIEAPDWFPNELRSIKVSLNPQFYAKFALMGSKAVFSAQSATQPSEVWSLDLRGGDPLILTGFNQAVKEIDMSGYSMRPYKWRNSKGAELTGYIRGYENKLKMQKAPLVVHVHGGPTSSVKWTFLDGGEVLAAKGYVVFYPNYTGSTGRGVRFIEANRGDMGGQDLKDILDGVQALVSEGGIDEKRVYITGGSYGGFMSMWAVTQTNVFRAAVARYGVSDWLSFHGTSNLSDWDTIHYDESPYLFQKYYKFSPIRYVQNVATPILLLHGEKDPYVPVGQSYQFYRALKDLGKEVSLVVYPREGHGFIEKQHFLDAQRRILDWFETHK